MDWEQFETQLKQDQSRVEAALHARFQDSARYADLTEAMEYSLLAGGKRIRPVLTLECCRLCGGDPVRALPLACGVEMIHTYSLIHDDLPAMDDDDLRRGRSQQTTKVVVGAGPPASPGPATVLLTAGLAGSLTPGRAAGGAGGGGCVLPVPREAGPEGMVGGQVLDMAGEGRALTRGELEQLQQLKTGALISAAAELGCIAAGGTEEQRCAVREYARCIGRAFQIQDDILDVTGDQEVLGKNAGSDEKNQKTTYVTIEGLEKAKKDVEILSAQAIEDLNKLPGNNEFLENLINILIKRQK